MRSRAVTMGRSRHPAIAWGAGRGVRILRDEVLPAFERLGDVREQRDDGRRRHPAIAWGAGRASASCDEVLPAFERLGDVRERAATMGKIANLQSRGGRTRRSASSATNTASLRAARRVRSRAVTREKIATPWNRAGSWTRRSHPPRGSTAGLRAARRRAGLAVGKANQAITVLGEIREPTAAGKSY